MMVEVSKTADTEVGDGTTSVVILAGSLIGKAEELIDKVTVVLVLYQEKEEIVIECLKKIRPYNLEKKEVIINIDKVLHKYRLIL